MQSTRAEEVPIDHDQFDFDKAKTDPFDPNKPYYDPGNQEWLRRRIEEGMIRRGVDPIQARKESMEAMNTLARINKKDFEKRTTREAQGIEERLLREGVDPDEARTRARREAEEHIRDLDRPKPYRPGSRTSRSQRSRDPGGLPALITGYVIAGVVIPLAALAFYVLLALMAGR